MSKKDFMKWVVEDVIKFGLSQKVVGVQKDEQKRGL